MNNRNNIRIYILILYVIAVCLMVSLIVCANNYNSNDVFALRKSAQSQRLDTIEYQWVDDDSLPCGGKMVLSFTMDELRNGVEYVSYYTIHQNTNVYIDGELIYSLAASEENLFSRTPGNIMNSFPLVERDIGKGIKIEIIPVYESQIGYLPEVYTGDMWDRYLGIMKGESMAAGFAVVSLVLGIIFIFWFIYNKIYKDDDSSILYIGLFSTIVGFWKLTDLEFTSIVVTNNIVASMLPIISLILVTVPVFCFFREFFGRKYEKIYDCAAILGAIAVFVIFALQLFNIFDLRQMLVVSHISFAILILIGGTHMTISIARHGWNKGLIIGMICLMLCLLGAVVDIAIYYTTVGSVTSAFGMVGFISYVVVMGVFKIRESTLLILQGKKAAHYKVIAYHDAMTGVLSRSAFEELVGGEDYDLKTIGVVMFDLNNLKKCNDTFGHEAGDTYIKESVNLINKSFGKIGDIYRLGGDEFCCIVKEANSEMLQTEKEELRLQEELHNHENQEAFPIHIACGFALFDSDEDYDILDTERRADKRMYKDKMLLKKEN